MVVIVAGIRLARRLLDVLLVVLILAALSGVIIGKVIPITGHPALVIGGPSMSPAIGVGSAVILDRVVPADVRVGDIVSLEAGSAKSIFTHRVIRTVQRADGVWVATKGDANRDEDPTLTPASTIVGRVAWTIPYAGYLLTVLSLPVGVLFLIGSAGALLAGVALLESIELRGAGRRRRILRKVRTRRPLLSGAMLPPATPLPASQVTSTVRRIAGANGNLVGAVRPDGQGGWAAPQGEARGIRGSLSLFP